MAYGTQVSYVGNVVADPELRFTQSGKAVASFRLAWSQGKEAESGYVSVTAWEGLGENVAASVEKGTRVVVVGTPTFRTWEDKDGNKRNEHGVRADDVALSLFFDTGKVNRGERQKGASKPASDPWDTPSAAQGGEEPF